MQRLRALCSVSSFLLCYISEARLWEWEDLGLSRHQKMWMLCPTSPGPTWVPLQLRWTVSSMQTASHLLFSATHLRTFIIALETFSAAWNCRGAKAPKESPQSGLWEVVVRCLVIQFHGGNIQRHAPYGLSLCISSLCFWGSLLQNTTCAQAFALESALRRTQSKTWS